MPLTVKKHRKSKVIKHTNKKKVRKQHSKLPAIRVPQLSQEWDDRKSAKKNLSEMGLSFDANKAVRRSKKSEQKNINLKKTEVAAVLEKEAKAPRVVTFKFPKPQALYFSYLISKYGDDFKAMAKDPKNVYQETWKQIRAKIMKFKKLQQYTKVMGGAS